MACYPPKEPFGSTYFPPVPQDQDYLALMAAPQEGEEIDLLEAIERVYERDRAALETQSAQQSVVVFTSSSLPKERRPAHISRSQVKAVHYALQENQENVQSTINQALANPYVLPKDRLTLLYYKKLSEALFHVS
jgi:hypothetical protein